MGNGAEDGSAPQLHARAHPPAREPPCAHSMSVPPSLVADAVVFVLPFMCMNSYCLSPPHPYASSCPLQDSAEHAAKGGASFGAADAAADGVQRLSVTDAQPAAGDDSAHAAGGPSTAGAAAPAAGAGRDGKSSNATSSAAAAAPAVDVSSPDAVAVHCLLAGLHSVQDGELPIMTSDFQSKHMIPSLPEGGQLIQVEHHRK